LKRVAAKGKAEAVTRPVTRPGARKVTQIASPIPEIVEVAAPKPVTGPSQGDHPALFEGSVEMGEKAVGNDAGANPGKSAASNAVGLD